MKIGRRIVYLVLALLLVAGSGVSQNAEPSQEKQALIKELIDALGVNRWTVKGEMKDTNIADILDPVVPRHSQLTNAQKQAAEAALVESKARLMKRIEVFLSDSSESGAVLTGVAEKLIDSTFTTEELRSLVEFYSTPLGKKAASFTMSLNNNISRRFGDAWSIRFKEFSEKALKEETEVLEEKLTEIKKGVLLH